MKWKTILLLTLVLTPLISFSQIITFSNPTNFSVCQDARVEIRIQNTEATPLTSVQLNLTLPCEVSYVAGTVTGAQENNIGNLSEPVFDLADIPPNGIAVLSLTLHAPCIVQDCIDNGTLFENIIELQHSNGSTSLTTDPYVVETPLLVITRIENPVMSGTQGQTLTRTFRIRNTRLGSVDAFTFTDQHDLGVSFSADKGTDISPDAATFKVSLSGSDFAASGDGDALFEFNEELILREFIYIDSCSFNQQTILSELFVSWGCDGDICTTPIPNQLAVTQIEFNPNTGPILEFVPMVNDPSCFCSDDFIPQGLSIANTDNFSAVTDFWIEINQSVLGSSIPEGPIRLVIGNDTTLIEPVFQNASDQNCLPNIATFQRMAINLPIIAPGEKVTLLWDVVFCYQGGCASDGNVWTFNYNYFKECAQLGDSYHAGNSFGTGPETYGMTSHFMVPSGTIADGQTANIAYLLQGAALDDEQGILTIDLQIPCGLVLQATDWAFAGQLPSQVSIQNQGAFTNVALEYPLPLSVENDTLYFPVQFLCDSLCNQLECKDSLVTSCMELCIPQGANFGILAVSGMNVDNACPANCVPETCTTGLMGYDCPMEVCTDTILGYAERVSLSFLRTNFGLPDTNDDYTADPGDPYDFNKMRLDRAMTEDTLRLASSSVVRIDVPGTTYVNGLLDFGISARCSSPNFPICSVPSLLNPETGLINFYNEVRVYDSSNGQVYTCTQLPRLTSGSSIFRYDISVENLATCSNMPLDFEYAMGDSILVEAYFKVKYNLAYVNTSNYINPRTALVSAQPEINLYNGEELTEAEDFICGCSAKSIDITGYGINNPGNLVSYISKCQTQTTIGAREVFSVNLRFNNFFPYEFRPISQLLKWNHQTHPSMELVNLNVESLANNGQLIFQNASVPFTTDNGLYQSSFSTLIPGPLDESYQVTLTMEYQTIPCGIDETEIALDRTYCYRVEKGYEALQSEYVFPKRYARREPALHLASTLCDATFLNNKVEWELLLDNTLAVTNTSPEVTAYHSWLRPFSASGQVGDFTLVNMETGQMYPQVNGIFQLDSLQNQDSLRLLLVGFNQSCEQEKIDFQYGWSCDLYTDPIDPPCVVQNLECSLITPPGVIDMQADLNGISAPLCDTMPWLEIEIFDAGLGAVFDLTLEVQLPPGMQIPSGSSEVAYPADSNNYLPIGDPQDLGNGLYRWLLTDQVDTLSVLGLPGVNVAPANALSLRFRTLTDCDFISGTFALYSATAQKVCDLPTNSVAKIGQPIEIDGVAPPYATSITSSILGNPGCEDSLRLNIRVLSATAFGANDSILIQLPAGIAYLPGTCSGTLANCQPLEDGNLLLWPLPPGLQSVDLSLALGGFLGTACQDLNFSIYTTNTVNANCTSTGQDCALKVLTGSKTVLVTIDKPVFSITDFTATTIPGVDNSVNLNFNVRNEGPENVDPIVVALYLDEDGDGQLSAGDVLVTTIGFNELIGQGLTKALSINGQAVSPEDICKLMLVISEGNNCICAPDAAVIQGPFNYRELQNDTICSGEIINIGRATLAGHFYQWEMATGLSCLNCAMAEFSAINNGFNPITYQLVLNDRNGNNCLASFEYWVTVQPVPSIWSAEEELCSGDKATLLASPGVLYQWQGEGIINPNQQIQMVSPANSGWYYVTITDNQNCIGTDSTFIRVVETPIADAGENIQTCIGATVQLDAFQQAGYSYLWSPGFPRLDDPTIANPMVLWEANQTYTLTVFNENCSSTDQVNVSFFDGLDLQVTGNQTICLGDTAFLQVSGADVFVWSPSFLDMCVDASCTMVRVAPLADTDFTLIGTTDDGCVDTLTVSVKVLDAELVSTENLTACEGTSIILFGEEISQAGMYCDTTESPGGCMEISCVNLAFTNIINTSESQEICSGESVDFNGQNYSTSGNYCVTNISVNGCDSIHCLNLTVLPLGDLSIAPDDPAIEVGESVQLQATANLNDYSWMPSESLSCDDCADPLADPLVTTLYVLEAVDDNGCPVKDSIQVRIVNICESQALLIPDAFTADNNGKNDRFHIVNLSEFISSVSIEVYNRWGELVYFEEGNEGWDGTYKGEPAPEDVYLYLIRAQCTGQPENLYKGNVTLLR